jgi:hypothetical protein
MPAPRVNGDAWVEASPAGADPQDPPHYFVFGMVDDEEFIIDGPWETERAAQAYLQRHVQWARARGGR